MLVIRIDQASHLHELYNVYGKGLDLLSEITGLTKNTISYSIKAYEITSEYHKRYPEDNEWVSKYSYFFELIKKPAVEKWIENKTNLRMVMKWIANKQILRGDEIRRISPLLQNKAALAKMKNGEILKNALAVTERKPLIPRIKEFKERANNNKNARTDEFRQFY